MSPPRSRAGHFYYVTSPFSAVSNRCVPIVSASYRSSTRNLAQQRYHCIRSWDSAGRPLRFPASSPGSLPVVHVTRSASPHQIDRFRSPSGRHHPVHHPPDENSPSSSGIPALRPQDFRPVFVRSALAERKLRARRMHRQIDPRGPGAGLERLGRRPGVTPAEPPSGPVPKRLARPGAVAELAGPCVSVQFGEDQAQLPDGAGLSPGVRGAGRAGRVRRSPRPGCRWRATPRSAGRAPRGTRCRSLGRCGRWTRSGVVPDGEREAGPDGPGPDADSGEEERRPAREHHGGPVCQRGRLTPPRRGRAGGDPPFGGYLTRQQIPWDS